MIALGDVPVVRGVPPRKAIRAWFESATQRTFAGVEDPMSHGFAGPAIEPRAYTTDVMHTLEFAQENPTSAQSYVVGECSDSYSSSVMRLNPMAARTPVKLTNVTVVPSTQATIPSTPEWVSVQVSPILGRDGIFFCISGVEAPKSTPQCPLRFLRMTYSERSKLSA